MKNCGNCLADDAADCGGLYWGALVVQHDNPVMSEDFDPIPDGPEDCSCDCHKETE